MAYIPNYLDPMYNGLTGMERVRQNERDKLLAQQVNALEEQNRLLQQKQQNNFGNVVYYEPTTPSNFDGYTEAYIDIDIGCSREINAILWFFSILAIVIYFTSDFKNMKFIGQVIFWFICLAIPIGRTIYTEFKNKKMRKHIKQL